jgi:DNA-directed RNA polymerase subunit H (RpoH/RPB5)
MKINRRTAIGFILGLFGVPQHIVLTEADEQEEVLQELYAIAFSDPRDIVDCHGKLLEIHEMSDNTRRSISSVHLFEDSGEIEIRFWSKLNALGLIQKYLETRELPESVNELHKLVACEK